MFSATAWSIMDTALVRFDDGNIIMTGWGFITTFLSCSAVAGFFYRLADRG